MVTPAAAPLHLIAQAGVTFSTVPMQQQHACMHAAALSTPDLVYASLPVHARLLNIQIRHLPCLLPLRVYRPLPEG